MSLIKKWLPDNKKATILVLAVISFSNVMHVLTAVIPKPHDNVPLNVYNKAAVATIGPECAPIGSDIMKHKNGSAVDAAIAAVLCEGISSLHSAGIGGGFFMTIYDAPSGKAEFLDARETAPGLANTTMYGGDDKLNFYGGLAVAVPGEIKGYWEAHQKYGRVPWKDLFEPSIKLCEQGAIVTKNVESNMKKIEQRIRNESSLAEILINPATNELYAVGERIKRPKLAETLRKLADAANPADLFYKGDIAKQLADDIQKFGGIITQEDFSNYEVNWRSPIKSKIGNKTMYTASPPGSGVLLAFIMNVLENMVPVDNPDAMWQRIIESFKWAYAKRTELADPDFVDISELVGNLTSKDLANSIKSRIWDNQTFTDPRHYGAVTSLTDSHGTAHVSVLAPDGSAVSVTSTINQILGAKIRSKATGIIFNNEMNDFSSPDITNGFNLPPSPNNYIKPRKRPFSSMAPTIVLGEDGKVQLIFGGVGGTRITTAMALVMLLNLYSNYNIEEAVDAPRLHHQLIPMQVQFEHDFAPNVLNYLREIGHKVVPSTLTSGIIAIANSNGKITGNPDRLRRQGKIAGF